MIEKQPFLRGYSVMRLPIVRADGTPEWPEMFPLEKIEQLRASVGQRHFSSQMMLEYLNDEKLALDPEALHFYDFDFDPRFARLGDNLITGVSFYWDPSAGRAKSDGSVCALVYKDDKNKRAFVHDIRYLKVSDGDLHPLGTQCDEILDFMRMHGLRNIAVEVNGIGSALPEILGDVAKKKGQALIVQKITNHKNKEARILDSIEPVLTTGRLWMRRRICGTRLMTEMLEWSPIAANARDDGLDALAGALQMRASPVRPMSAGFKILKANTDFKI
ncbi:MAG: hypothetical protein LBD50_02725 [Rickettsiales bacterium]|jgi:hypothetical protein|nr:hypothetical protein [Rickettsiales bacterium]